MHCCSVCTCCRVQEDKKVKDRIDARNTLESYCYNLKNSMEDSEKGLADKMGEDDKSTVETAVQVCASALWDTAAQRAHLLCCCLQDALDWMEENQEADTEEFKAKLKELEKVVNPIMQKVYQASGGAPGGAPGGGDDEDFGHDDL